MKGKNKKSGSQAPVVVCDWGSTHLRAYVVDADGNTLQGYESERGVKFISGKNSSYCEELLTALDALQMPPESEIRISGMAGSKLGWLEAGYVSTPVGVGEFSSNYLRLPDFTNARLYGGVKHQHGNGSLDVMRGEELQVFGILDTDPDARIICLPGTHSKWVTVENGKIISFKTYMTGDLFHSLCEGSIFKEQITSREFHQDGFLHGCRLGVEGNDLQNLFRLRSDYVFSQIPPEAFHSCLSGFLIMNEIKSASPESGVRLCGSLSLTSSYALALKQMDVESHTVDSETATVRGHLDLIS